MKKNITAGLAEDDLVNEVRMNFMSSSVIRKRILKLIKDKEDAAYASSFSKDGYESPNWALKQSDTVGYIRALREVASLLED